MIKTSKEVRKMKKKLKKGQGFQFPDDPTIPPPEWFVFGCSFRIFSI